MRRSLSFLVATYLLAGCLVGQEPPATTGAEKAPATDPGAGIDPRAISPAPSSPPTPLPKQEETPRRRGWLGRMLHPFSSGATPQYKDPKIRGLSLQLQVSPQTVKLSEIRQLQIKVTLINISKRAVELNFPNDQRIEIYLTNSSGLVLTKWSDNHAVSDKPGIVLINPKEHIEYNEKIATRELARGKVYAAEVFFPQYPELRIRQKFMTAP